MGYQYNSKENSTRLHTGHNRSQSNPIILNNQWMTMILW